MVGSTKYTKGKPNCTEKHQASPFLTSLGSVKPRLAKHTVSEISKTKPVDLIHVVALHTAPIM